MNAKQKAIINIHLDNLKRKEGQLGFEVCYTKITDLDEEEFFKDHLRREARPVMVSIDFEPKVKTNYKDAGHMYLFRVGPRGGLESYTDYTRKAMSPKWQAGLRPITTKPY